MDTCQCRCSSCRMSTQALHSTQPPSTARASALFPRVSSPRPESWFCETTAGFPWHLPDRLLALSFLCSLCPAESVRIPPCAFSFLKNLGHVSPTVVHVSPCRWMDLFMSFNFSGVLGGIRDNHVRSVPQV